MKSVQVIILGALTIVAASCVSSPFEREDTAVVPTPTPTVIEEFLARTWPYMDRFGPIDSAVIDKMVLVAQEATRPWSEDPSLTQADAVRPGVSKFRNLDSMSTDELREALSTRARPFIPRKYRQALETAAMTLDAAIIDLDALISDWSTLSPPPEAGVWHTLQFAHFTAVKASYGQMLANRRSVLESGTVSVDAKQDATLRLLTEQGAKDAAERAFKRMESLYHSTPGG